jgi:hypothetical protein
MEALQTLFPSLTHYTATIHALFKGVFEFTLSAICLLLTMRGKFSLGYPTFSPLRSSSSVRFY